MLKKLKEQVYRSNMELVQRGLVVYTWGNVSGIDRKNDYVVIKPSGIKYEELSSEDMVVVDLWSGEVIEGNYKPSSDTDTHLEIYKAFPSIGGIAHTHSINAVAFAQAGMDIPALGTTHADYFYGHIPCTRELTKEEVRDSYEKNTGKVIVECIKARKIDAISTPGIVVRNHGPFSWGLNAADSVYHAVVMEQVAEMDLKTLLLNPEASMKQYVLDRHFMRKHGNKAYYGQRNK